MRSVVTTLGSGTTEAADRAWVTAWSPEQIANRLAVDVPDEVSLRISHGAICRALCIEGRGRAQTSCTCPAKRATGWPLTSRTDPPAAGTARSR